ncbi:MAG TPA: sigma-54 dependent transcriptional regulator [Rectinemataceae bacterium]
MAPSPTLRKLPSSANLPVLFEIQRILALNSDIGAALPACAEKLQASFPGSLCHIAFSEGGGIRILASAGEGSIEASGPAIGSSVKLGYAPCGLAIASEGPVRSELGSALILEAPIIAGGRIMGAISLSLAPAKPGDRQGLSQTEQDAERAFESIQWTCRLAEEALGLRISLAERTKREVETAQDSLSPRSRLDGETRQRESDSAMSFHGLIGASDAMQEVYRLIGRVASTDATVLITGESGTGKELAAKALHACGLRPEGPFIAVNCSALPESVIESELFGHERGAFTGAIATRMGRFESAQNGTLFLDEIGDLSPSVQVKLLRILQERSFERVGGNRSISTNARIIAATHRDLAAEVAAGRFREDLFFRLNVFPIHLPPLRERGADILLLADHFAEKLGKTSGKRIKRISTPALDLLMIYHWPGNVRELENVIARAIILSGDGVIHSYDLPPSLQSASSTGTEPLSSFDAAVARLEKEMLVEALKIERGNSAAASKRLGVSERRFRFALQKYKLDYRTYRTKM